MDTSSTNGLIRDENGRFIKGCPPGPGNPHVAKVALWRAAMAEGVSREDIDAVIKVLVEKAKTGERWAVRELLDRTLGKPLQPVAAVGVSEDRRVVLKLKFDEPALRLPVTPET
ncbi:MAG: hypothetical protein V3T48_11145 [Vicinamibacterales bacterium]